MTRRLRFSAAMLILSAALPFLSVQAQADDKAAPDKATKAADHKAATAAPATGKAEAPPAINLLQAMNQGKVWVRAVGRSDGRLDVSLTNRTHKPLRVILPPGVVAQNATGQMGGMMGGMGGGMGGGMMGGGGGMGGGGTMPPMMGMMTLARMIMYFCGDFDSWDMRSLMMGMGGGMMGGMGGGMMGGGMGGMGGGMGGMMGGGMGSVPPTGPPFADLKPRQTRTLPTRVVSLSPPDANGGVQWPREGEAFRVGEVADAFPDPRVQKAMRRLAAEKAERSVAQLVMWKVAAGLDWDAIAELSKNWANPFQMAMARDFVDRLDADGELPDESGRICFDIQGEEGGQARAAELKKAIEGKVVLGLKSEMSVPARPEGPSLACRVRIKGDQVQVQLVSSDATARSWVAFGKFTLPAAGADGKADGAKLADAIAEGLISRLVRAQVVKGPREKGKLTYKLRIENASPLRLNGVAAVGEGSKPDVPPRVLVGISVPPRRSMTVPAREQVIRDLGLRQGIRITAVDLSGL